MSIVVARTPAKEETLPLPVPLCTTAVEPRPPSREWAAQSWGAESLGTSLGEVSLSSTLDDFALSSTFGAAAFAGKARAHAAPVRPAYLTMASINRYAGDCAARAALADRSTRPAPAHLVWRWYDMADIPAMVQRTAGEVLVDLQDARSQRAEGQRRGELDNPAGKSRPDPVASLPQLSRGAATARHTHGAKPGTHEDTGEEREERGSGTATEPRSAASMGASRPSQPVISDPRENLLIAACGSLLAADFDKLQNSSISKETTRLSTSIPKPRTVQMTNVASSRQLPDGLTTPVTGLYFLASTQPRSRRDADQVKWSSKSDEDTGVMTLHVRTPGGLEARNPTPKTQTPDQRPVSKELGISYSRTTSPYLPTTPERNTRRGLPAPVLLLELDTSHTLSSVPKRSSSPLTRPAKAGEEDEPRLELRTTTMGGGEDEPQELSIPPQQLSIRKKTTGPSNLHAYTSPLLASRNMCMYVQQYVYACVPPHAEPTHTSTFVVV
jgi:hypothetical protein